MEPGTHLKPLLDKVRAYISEAILPLEAEYLSAGDQQNRWQQTPRQQEILDQLKQGAREQGLWNFFLTEGEHSSGLKHS